jgi:hypothetical protein
MAPHVSRFLQRLFDVDAPAEGDCRIDARAGRPLPLQGRLRPPPALPLLKGGAHVSASAEDDAIVERMIADQQTSDRELAVARAGCALLDRERSASPKP